MVAAETAAAVAAAAIVVLPGRAGARSVNSIEVLGTRGSAIDGTEGA